MSKKKRADNAPVENEAVSKPPAGRRTRFIIIAAFVVIILIIIGVSLYPTQIAPFRRTIITVDDITIRMDYFLKRTELAGADAMTMLDILTREQIIIIQAPRIGIEVNPEDIDQELRRIARGESETITESEFKEWYRQQLNEAGLSDAEFRELMHTSLLTARLHEYLAERVPTVAEQVHVQIILIENYDEALKVRGRWEAGEAFADLAREVSMLGNAEQGGEVGWFPQGVMNPSFDYAAFTLDIGQVSEPLGSEEGFYLLMVSEKAVAREIDEASMGILRGRVLDDWLVEEMQFHDISYNFNSEINAWISWQLAKRSKTSQQQ